MICGMGLDVCAINRMEKHVKDERFLHRFFTEEEQAYVAARGVGAAQSLAGIFAAKEAFAKALGTGFVFDLRDVEILHDALGKPFYQLHGRAAELAGANRFFLSLSHDGGVAAAVCVREAENLLPNEGKASIMDT